MSRGAHVQSDKALETLRAALNRFAGEARDAVSAGEHEAQRTLTWLAERQRYWEGQVRLAQTEVTAARRALEACEASGRYDSQTGRYYPPNCGREQAMLARAHEKLRANEAELRRVHEAVHRVQHALAEYQRQANRLKGWLDTELARATAFLSRKADDLQRYQSLALLAAGFMGLVSLGSRHSAATSGAGRGSPPTGAAPPAVPTVDFVPMNLNDNGQYDKAHNTIHLNAHYADVKETALLEPILAHEAVHARYQSDDPHDEASLQAYVEEEMEAYRAQHDTWQKTKDDFYQHYPTASTRGALSEGTRDLLAAHLIFDEEIQQGGWAGKRQELEAKYRARMV